MEQKTKALKTASKVISVITNIGYIAMIVMVCICISIIAFLAINNGETSLITVNGVKIAVTDDMSVTAAELTVMCIVYIVMGGFLFTISLLAHRMFGEIAKTGDPFVEKYVKTIRAIGILVAVTTFATGLVDAIVSATAKTAGVVTYSEAPGLVIGAIIFCLSYIVDYGCTLKKQA